MGIVFFLIIKGITNKSKIILMLLYEEIPILVSENDDIHYPSFKCQRL